MGLLDKFKKKEKSLEVDNTSQTKKTFDAEFKTTIDGMLQVDFFDGEADFHQLYDTTRLVDFFDREADSHQLYDTTRLIVSREPLNLAEQDVYNCAVSWYSRLDDPHMLNKRTGQVESKRASEYRRILAQIDLNLLRTDSNYCKALMKGLLNKERVEKYLKTGLEETPDNPCGKYIGGIMQTEKGYVKFFSQTVGIASHYSDSMVKRRSEHRQIIERQKQSAIENKRAQIEKLQSEINDISK